MQETFDRGGNYPIQRSNRQQICNRILSRFLKTNEGDEIEAYDLIGAKMRHEHYLKTHVEFNIFYNEDNNTVDFKFYQIAYANVTYPKRADLLPLSKYEAGSMVEFSYNVNFYKFNEGMMPEEYEAEKIHWIGILNSFIFVKRIILFRPSVW